MNVSEFCPSLSTQNLGMENRNATRTPQSGYPKAKNNP